MSAVPTVVREDREELRIALVMSGGLSLAVWMGGVAREVSRLLRRDGAYGELLDLTGSEARVDVISGTSAGGLNGALLALAIARCQPLDSLRTLWLNKGGFAELFRSPLQKDPPSLLQGDEYFLPALKDALGQLNRSQCGGQPPESQPPINLFVTTSILDGQTTKYTDDFGAVITDVDHHGLFTFRRGSEAHHWQVPGEGIAPEAACIHEGIRESRDDFTDPAIVDALALASRCSASFPLAFEPSLCPVGETTDDPRRPDMRCYANFNRTRFTVDGGVLMNKPLAPAIKAIYEEPASRQVRRVLAFVDPDPGSPAEAPADKAADMPAIAQTLIDSLVTLPRTETIGGALQEIRERNDRARSQRRMRERWLRAGSLPDQATELMEDYRRLRAEESIERVIKAMEKGLARSRQEMPFWNPAKLRPALMAARLDALPESFPAVGWTPKAEDWKWGLQPVENAAVAVLDLLRKGARLVVPRTTTAGAPGARGSTDADAIWAARERVHEGLKKYRDVVIRADTDFWEGQAGGALKVLEESRFSTLDDQRTAVVNWATEAFSKWDVDMSRRQRLVDTALELAGVLKAATPSLRALIKAAQDDRDAPQTVKEGAAALAGMLDALVGKRPPAEKELLRSLLALDVVHTVLLPHTRVTEQEVELIQVSAHTPNLIGGTDDPSKKVAGIQLGHFGAFYKRSWRANDWMYGRLDGSYKLAQVLLDPQRIRQRRLGSADAFKLIEHAALGEGQLRTTLLGDGSTWNPAEIKEELAYLDHPGLPAPTALPRCVDAVARRLQLDIARSELRSVALAVEADLQAGGAHTSAEMFMTEVNRLPGEGRLKPADALRLFPDCEVGAEKIGDEAGSDMFSEVVSTAAAVGVSAGQGRGSGIPAPVRGFLASLRGFTMALWVMMRATIQSSKTGAALTAFALAIGGAFVALAMLAPDPPSIVIALGAALVAAGLAAAFIRAGSARATLIVVVGLLVATLPLLIGLVAGWVDDSKGEWWADALLWVKAHRDDLTPIFLVFGLAAGSMALGLVRKKPARPKQ